MALDIRALYQEAILDHSRCPRNVGRLGAPTHLARLRNQGCADEIALTLQVTDGTIIEAAFEGSGCAISTASASMMTEAITGVSVRDAAALGDHFHSMLCSGMEDPLPIDKIGKLVVFGGVRQVPSRAKCALLPWQVFQRAIAE